MGGSLSEGLRTIFAVVLACLVIGFVFVAWNGISSNMKTQQKKTEMQLVQLAEEEVVQYENQTVTGAEVRNFIDAHKDLVVEVDAVSYNNTYTSGTNAVAKVPDTNNKTLIDNSRDRTNANYISPKASYLCSTIRDKDSEVVGIKFTKQ